MGGNERLSGEDGIPMASGQERVFSDLKVVSVSSDVEARIKNCSWWFFLDQMTMVQWSVLEMAIDVSEIKKSSKSARNCYQTKMKPCPFAISDEWYVLTVKYRRSSDELDLAEDDGWMKEFEGWRAGNKFGGYFMILVSINALATSSYVLFRRGSYYFTGSISWWRYYPTSAVSLDVFHGSSVLPELLACLGPFYVIWFMPLWKFSLESVDCLGDYQGFTLGAILLAWCCLRFHVIRDCYGLKDRDDDTRIFSSLNIGCGGYVLPVGHLPNLSRAACVRGRFCSDHVEIVLDFMGLGDSSLPSFFKPFLQCANLEMDDVFSTFVVRSL
ncbi:hypothetical protein V6N13_094659 [Hibiscus sabdariffa]